MANYVFLTLFTILAFYPFWEVIRISFSTPAEANRMAFMLWPRESTLAAFKYVLKNEFIWMVYKTQL